MDIGHPAVNRSAGDRSVSWRRWHDGPTAVETSDSTRRPARLWPIVFTTLLAAVCVVLFVIRPHGAARVGVAAVGDLVATISMAAAMRWYRPPFRPVGDLLVASTALLTVTTALLPWSVHGGVLGALGLAMLVLLNLATPALAFYATRPYLRTDVLWDRMIPIVAFVLLLPVVGFSRINGEQFDRRAIVVLLGAMYVAGLVFAGPVVVRLGRTADLLMYLCIGVLFANLVAITGGSGATATYRAGPVGQFLYAAVAAVAIWHPTMTHLGRPLDVGAVSRYAHGRTIWIALFVVAETTIFAIFTRHNVVAVSSAIACTIAAAAYVWWSLATGRSSASTVLMERALRKALASGDVYPARQPLVTTTGTRLGSVVWARWDHRRLGVLPACEWWPVARRANLTAAVERELLRSLRDEDAGGEPGDPGVLVVTLDDPAAHTELLAELSRHAAVLVRCDHGFEAVRAAGCRVATTLELAAVARADVVEIPMSVTLAADGRSGRAVFEGIAQAASRLDALVLAMGVETPAALEQAPGVTVDLVCGYRFGRPELPRRPLSRPPSTRS